LLQSSRIADAIIIDFVRRDALNELANGRALDEFGGARLQVIPDAGRLPNLENPAAFNAAVRAFLKEIPMQEQL